MSAFLDTNVIVYAHDKADPVKQARAIEVMRRGDWAVSAQVMQEFFVVATRRLRTPLDSPTALAVLDDLAEVAVATDASLVIAAASTAIRNRISPWDALIVEAAKRAGCDRVLTEDLSDGQVIEGVLVQNPFAG